MRNFKLIAASILTILVAIVVVQNRDPVATHVLFASIVMPLAILLFITAAAGFTEAPGSAQRAQTLPGGDGLS